MRRWLKSALLAVGVIFMLSGAAYAQLSQDLELNIYGGGAIYSKKTYEISFPQSPTPIAGQFKLDETLRGGLRLNVYTRGHWGQEFFYSYEPNTAHFTRQTTPQTSLNLELNVHNVGINALYYLSDNEERRVRPFLGIGIGTAIYMPTGRARAIARDPLRGNVADLDTANELTLNYGAGVKAKLKSWIGVRMDVRGFSGRNPSFGLARESSDPNATVFPAGGAIHNGEVSVGFVFYFGKP
jgi:outer membrane protein W